MILQSFFFAFSVAGEFVLSLPHVDDVTPEIKIKTTVKFAAKLCGRPILTESVFCERLSQNGGSANPHNRKLVPEARIISHTVTIQGLSSQAHAVSTVLYIFLVACDFATIIAFSVCSLGVFCSIAGACW